MYQSYWNLDRSPFASDLDTTFLFPSVSHSAALLKLQYLVEEAKGAGVLAAPPGFGKTLTTHVLQQRLDADRFPVVRILYPRLEPTGFIAQLAIRLGVDAGAVEHEATLERLLNLLTSRLSEMAANRQAPVIVIDDAHLIDSVELWHCIRLLLNFREQGDTEFTILLVGQPVLLGQLQSFGDLYERLEVRVSLAPLTESEVEQYLDHRMKVAGTEAHVFLADAVTAVTELSEGTPRKINQLADLTLLVGYADRLGHISGAEMHAASDEMCVASID